MAERLMASVLKTDGAMSARGFESHSRRHGFYPTQTHFLQKKGGCMSSLPSSLFQSRCAASCGSTADA